MSLLVRVLKKRTARGKSNNRYVFTDFCSPGVFDIPYDSAVHKSFVLNEIRFHTRVKGHSRKSNSAIAYEKNEARRWQNAIRRQAPLFIGFFAEEPKWRDKMLSWCKKTLARRHTKRIEVQPRSAAN